MFRALKSQKWVIQELIWKSNISSFNCDFDRKFYDLKIVWIYARVYEFRNVKWLYFLADFQWISLQHQIVLVNVRMETSLCIQKATNEAQEYAS